MFLPGGSVTSTYPFIGRSPTVFYYSTIQFLTLAEGSAGSLVGKSTNSSAPNTLLEGV